MQEKTDKSALLWGGAASLCQEAGINIFGHAFRWLARPGKIRIDITARAARPHEAVNNKGRDNLRKSSDFGL